MLCCALISLAALGLWARLSPCPNPLAQVAFSRVILDADGGLLRMGLTPDQKYRLPTRLADLPPEAVDAVVRYEDRWFWHHPGVNPLSLVRAGLAMLAGGRVMGGSTITMQAARLAYGLRTGSLADKARQIMLALRLEAHFSKAEILEMYMSLAPYGANVEGLAAAARVWFHKDASRLLPSESLALMLVPQNPAVRTPGTKAFYAAAARLAKEWGLDEKRFAPPRCYAPKDLPFACPHLACELLAEKQLPATVRTGIDRDLQRRLETQLARFQEQTLPMGLGNAAAMLVRWTDRTVVATAGSPEFANEPLQGQIDGTRIRRSPGSTLKPFIYALALDQGIIHPRTLLSDMPRSFSGYDPENFDGAFRGPVPACDALRLSRNVPALWLAARLRSPDLYGFLTDAGVRFAASEGHYGLALVLGGAEVTMRELATLYCMLADGGVLRPLRTVLDRPEPAGRKILSPEACFATLSMLETSLQEDTLHGRGGLIPLRYKTGTSNGYRDAWTCGIIGPYVLAVWAGSFDCRPNALLVGARTALPLFRAIARELVASRKITDMHAVPDPALQLERIEVCARTGDVDTSLCQETAQTWFIPGVSPIRPTGIYRKILIDKETGLRACIPQEGKTQEVPWEFWPSELEQQFLRAGIALPKPPPYLPECASAEAPAGLTGDPPTIVLPKPGLIYRALPGDAAPIALMAHAAAGTTSIHWFLGTSLAGTTAPGESLRIRLTPGDYRIRAVDDQGRAAVRLIKVRETD